MVIRKEMAKDYGAVYSLVKKAFETPRENFMACRLAGHVPAPHGTVRYAKEFGIGGPEQ